MSRQTGTTTLPPHPWRLPGALGVRAGDMVAFVGAGGTTSAMFRLADALAAVGWGVLATTTTHLDKYQSSLAPRHLVANLDEDLRPLIAPSLNICSPILVTGPGTEDGLKWSGVSP